MSQEPTESRERYGKYCENFLVARRLAEATGVSVAGVSYRGTVRHVFTHRDVTAELFRVDVAASGPAAATADRCWIAPGGLAVLGVSSFARKTVALGVGR